MQATVFAQPGASSYDECFEFTSIEPETPIVALQQRRVFEGAVRRWGLVLDRPVVESPTGCVGFARLGRESFIVKAPSSNADETNSLAVLLHYRGEGAVRVLDHEDGVMLLERALPGGPLSDLVIAGKDDEATEILCDVAAVLHLPDPPQGGFPGVEDWGDGFERYRRSGDVTVPRSMVDRAARLFFDLAASQAPKKLLHGDLHHDNILHDDNRGWLAIDPKGVLGEPAYDFGAALRNPTEDPTLFATPAIIDRRLRIISERADLDRQRLQFWVFAQAVLSEIWAVEDGVDFGRGLATANAILPALWK